MLLVPVFYYKGKGSDYMEHSFDINIAKKYGIQAAVLLKNIYFWIEKNRANETNFYDGYYWTYNSKKAFSELFPYMTERQIDYTLKKLIDEGIIITGNYNKMAYDRTLWYAITKKGYSILQNCEMEETKLLNGNNENVEPIPDINTNINTNNKPNKKVSKKESFDDLINNYTNNEELRQELKNHLATRKSKKATLTNRAIELSFKKLDELVKKIPINEQEEAKIKIVQQSIERGWTGFFEVKEVTQYNNNKNTNWFDVIGKEEGIF